MRLALVLGPVLLALSCAGPEAPRESAPVDDPAALPPSAEAARAPEPEAPLALKDEAVPEPRPWERATAQRSSAGTYLVRFLSAPEPMPDNEPFTLDVWVFDPAWPDQPLWDVGLSMDADMPQHGHGMNLRPKVERGTDGRFHVTGMLFHMTGEWQVYFDVTRGAVTERTQLPVLLE